LKEQAKDFAQQKIDSAKARARDTLASVKNEVVKDLKNDIKDKVFGPKDSTNTNSLDSAKNKTGQKLKSTFKDLLNKKKKPATDTTKKE